MKYSLLVPCYNAASFVSAFLENIARLNPSFDEVLFYDDASTDNTVHRLLSSGYEVIRGDINRGPGYARNQLAKAAKGDYIHFHDIDDGLDPAYLYKTSAIARGNDYDVILCNVDWFDAAKQDIVLSWKYSHQEMIRHPTAYAITHPIGGINGLYRRQTVLGIGGFNTRIPIWEDADFHIRLAISQAKFYIVEETLAFALRQAASASADQTLGWLTRLTLLIDYAAMLNEPQARTAIGLQAQLAASHLILQGQSERAKTALLLSEGCSVKVPSGKALHWLLFKAILPRSVRVNLRLLQLKTAFRSSDESS
jgi:glycosyltransferase involved in cell wall biosynthesis